MTYLTKEAAQTLLTAMEEVLCISDRKYEAWDRAHDAKATLQAAINAPQAREPSDAEIDAIFAQHLSVRAILNYREFARAVLAARSEM